MKDWSLRKAPLPLQRLAIVFCEGQELVLFEEILTEGTCLTEHTVSYDVMDNIGVGMYHMLFLFFLVCALGYSSC